MGQHEQFDQAYETELRLEEGLELQRAGFNVPPPDDPEVQAEYERFRNRTAVQAEPTALDQIQEIY